MNADETEFRPKFLPIRAVELELTKRDDGTILMAQAFPMAEVAPTVAHMFVDTATRHPERIFLAKRRALTGGQWGDWQKLGYADALAQVRSAAQWLLDRGFGPGRSVLILSGPSHAHAILALAANLVGSPVAAAPPAYSLAARDFARLRHVFEVCQPAMVFMDDTESYAAALSALPAKPPHVVASAVGPGRTATAFSELTATPTRAAVARAMAALAPDTPARYIFTSGSTGAPKAVVHTHGSLMAQIGARNGLLADPSLEDGVARLSWLPWNHTAGVIQLHFTIADGGTYYVDEGRPVQGAFDETLRNLQEIIPAEFTSTPILYERLADALEQDDALRKRFFRYVRYATYASAALSDDLIERIQTLARQTIGAELPFCTKYGSTETNAVLHSAQPLRRAGEIGVPYAGATMKLVPQGDRFELRVKGPMVFKGYLGGGALNEGVFDEEDFYRTGDAVTFLDPADPSQGLVFAGRISENFKLSSGTWVSVGPLRTRLIESLAPLLRDAVIAGHDRAGLRVLGWLRREAAADFLGVPAATPMETLIADPRVRRFLAEKLATHNAQAEGTAQRIDAVLLMTEPPADDEIVDKGYINQSAVLRNRAVLAARLYAPGGDAELILPTHS